MSISIVVGNKLTFEVKGEFRDADGQMKPADFTLVARRMKGQQLTELLSQKDGPSIVDQLCELVEDWKGVKGEEGWVDFSPVRLRELLDGYPGLPAIAWNRYLQEVAVKAKN